MNCKASHRCICREGLHVMHSIKWYTFARCLRISNIYLGVSESISAEITVPPTGHCLDGIFKLCDWVEWTPWGECSNRCGTGVQTRRRRICCPLDIKENNVSQCVVDLCKFSMAQYRDNETCTSTKDCPPGTYWNTTWSTHFDFKNILPTHLSPLHIKRPQSIVTHIYSRVRLFACLFMYFKCLRFDTAAGDGLLITRLTPSQQGYCDRYRCHSV